MTTISATIIKDSVNKYGNRLTTLQLRYPRCIHAEFMTHRQFSRNASSSRAVPVKKLIQDVIDDPFIPLYWGKNQKGMQAGEEHDAPVCGMARAKAWEMAMSQTIDWARRFDDAGYHKQIVNRLLEPFSHINVVVTSTEWSNFFGLRCHPDAEPHIRMLADRIRIQMGNSTPTELKHGEWHLPYVEDEDLDEIRRWLSQNVKPIELMHECKIKLSVARCASVSYKTVDGLDMTVERALSLCRKLINANPIHASPAEHQGTPDKLIGSIISKWNQPRQHGNFKGWIQYRKTLTNECL